MNKLPAIVTAIEGEQNLHIIAFDFQGATLKMMGLDLPKGLHVGSHVVLGVKPSHIAIGKNISGDLSYSNQIPATIQTLENGALLSSIVLHVGDTKVQSFITCSSSKRMNLQVGDKVILLIKASDLFVQEVLDV
ncbi:MAG: TOBE domain-containing protein [Sulfurospirillaceae bacterium]|nr:TOBE domain-containing protein [Sulfurospirillaceae bacterium]MDD3462533.1 TOBE domain-containing protein [Sulfurospirillaceae bacterium]